jgi:hypothetical protein
MMGRAATHLRSAGLHLLNALALAAACALISGSVSAGAAGATVNWLDRLGYQKPQPIELHEPDEALVANKYWIDLSGGAGTTCSQSSPCRSFDDVLGKPGTKGGPAILYVKGTGGMSWYNDTINGSGNADCRTAACANWILVRTWPAGAPGCNVECTATITGNSNLTSPTGVHHIMFDGGPNLQIRFDSNGGPATYVNHVMADYVIVYRTQTFCTGSNGQLGWSVGDFSVANHVYFINNEFYGCGSTGDQSSAVYVGPGAGGGYTDFVFQNNIVRDFFGEGIEINPRVTSSGASIVGNAIYNVGKGTCATKWNCRPAITMSVQSGDGNNGTFIANNLMWDVGSGCIWDRGAGNPEPIIVNNTCFDYGKGTGSGGPNPEGISGFGHGGSAIVRNNIIYAENGTRPLDRSAFTASNNLCASNFWLSYVPWGSACGAASQTWVSNTVLSTDPGSPDFMKIGPDSPARNRGVLEAGVGTSYFGATRPLDGAFDIGADEYRGPIDRDRK